jgi:tetratricopeptide (TPR) repeat protein
MSLRTGFWIAFFLLLSTGVFAQSAQLAQQYYKDGEFEKAAQLYKQLAQRHKNTTTFTEKYVDCLIQLQEFKEAEEILNRKLQQDKKEPMYYYMLGEVFQQKGENEKSDAAYTDAIKYLEANRSHVLRLAQRFYRAGKIDYAIKTYQRGGDLLDDESIFAYNLGGLYQKKGDIPHMISAFLTTLKDQPQRLNQVKTLFQRYLTETEHFEILEDQVYSLIQKDGDAEQYPELLAWSAVQSENFRSALRQMQALDRRNFENGRRVYNLAQSAENAGDFATAQKGYDYVIEQKGEDSPYYFAAQQKSLNVRLKRLTQGFDFQKADIQKLFDDYNRLLNEKGRNPQTASIMEDQARVAALYLNDIPAAIDILEQMTEIPGMNPLVQSRAKVRLADYYLMDGKKWDATLLYAQVDKSMPEAAVGEQARYKNAMLSYYTGDFEWAQDQLDILKTATSRVISNDAIDRSVFIMDHLNLDTTSKSLELFSQAELLIFQNRFEAAEQKMDSVNLLFPEHTLAEEILYAKSKIQRKKQDFESVRLLLEQITVDYPEGLKADNALFEWAQLEEERFERPEKAKELYEKLFLEYTHSTFAEEARKRYRALRGDTI